MIMTSMLGKEAVGLEMRTLTTHSHIWCKKTEVPLASHVIDLSNEETGLLLSARVPVRVPLAFFKNDA